MCNKMALTSGKWWTLPKLSLTVSRHSIRSWPGGPLHPPDPYYLSWKAREYGFHTSMIEASMMVNDRMPEYTVERAGKILNRYKKALNGSKVLVLGVAYKQDIDDYRESPAIRVIEEFHKTGAMTDFYDPFIPKYRHEGQWYQGLEALTPETVKAYDLVIITTAHTKVDYQMVAECGVPVFDCKNADQAHSKPGEHRGSVKPAASLLGTRPYGRSFRNDQSMPYDPVPISQETARGFFKEKRVRLSVQRPVTRFFWCSGGAQGRTPVSGSSGGTALRRAAYPDDLLCPRKVLMRRLAVDADLYHLHDPELLPLRNPALSAGGKR